MSGWIQLTLLNLRPNIVLHDPKSYKERKT